MKLRVDYAEGTARFEGLCKGDQEIVDDFIAQMDKLGYDVQGDCYEDNSLTVYFEEDLSYYAPEIAIFARDNDLRFQGEHLSKSEKPTMDVNYGENTVAFYGLDDDCQEAEDFIDMMEKLGFHTYDDGANRGFRLYEFSDSIDELDYTFRCFAHEHRLSFFRMT